MITVKQLLALLPLLIITSTVIILMLCIAWRHFNFLNIILTVIGLLFALISIFFNFKNSLQEQEITQLLYIDNYSNFYMILVIIASLETAILAYYFLFSNKSDDFYLLLLITTIGSIFLVSSNHLVALFLGIELISFPLIGIIGYKYRKNKYSLEASMKYMILSSIASSFLLFGIALLYANTGQLSFMNISDYFNSNNNILYPSLGIISGLGMMLVGLGFKLSLVPFHLWTPDVYQGTSAPMLIILGITKKISIFSVLMRFFILVPITKNEVFRFILEIISFFSIFLGNIMALSQNNIKRILGYSSISNLGYLIIGLISVQINPNLALESVGIYFIGYLLTNSGIFGIMSLISRYNLKYKNINYFLSSYRGLFWHNPILTIVFTIMMLSLAGIPMTIGFIGKFYIITLGINSKLWFLTGSLIIGSIIGLFYYLRIIINFYLFPINKKNIIDISFLKTLKIDEIIIFINSFLIFLFGIYPQPLINLVQAFQY